MKKYIENGIKKIEMSKKEYISTCIEWNNEHRLEPENQYDITEINETIPDIDACVRIYDPDFEEGFLMFKEHFYRLY